MHSAYLKRLGWITGLLALLSLSCYKGHGLSPPGGVSGIEGRITFIGQWPDSTQEVRVAVLKEYPEGIHDADSLLAFVILNLAGMTDPAPMDADRFDYQLRLDPGTYAWVLVVWLPENLFGIKQLGAYYLNPGDENPAAVEVQEGVMLDGINIIADFANVDNENPFFKRRRP